ncbi:unnamed protein product, partial [Iphiclides podalirius]
MFFTQYFSNSGDRTDNLSQATGALSNRAHILQVVRQVYIEQGSPSPRAPRAHLFSPPPCPFPCAPSPVAPTAPAPAPYPPETAPAGRSDLDTQAPPSLYARILHLLGSRGFPGPGTGTVLPGPSLPAPVEPTGWRGPLAPGSRAPLAPGSRLPLAPGSRLPLAPDSRAPLAPGSRLPLAPGARGPVAPDSPPTPGSLGTGSSGSAAGSRELVDTLASEADWWRAAAGYVQPAAGSFDPAPGSQGPSP